MTGELDVLQMVNALESDHLEQALELLHVSKASHREDDSDEIWPDRKAHLYALSSIMHSFAAFEGQVNRIAYGILREPQNPHFIPAEKRTYEFREMIARWDVGLAIDKKVEFLLGLRNTNQPADLLPNLRELVLLRNWIVHGKVYRTELLIERKGEEPNSGTLHLRADGEEWAPKFPRFKFPMPDRLSYPEARGFFLAMCSTIHCLGRSCGFPLVLITDRKPKITIVILGTEQEDPISKLTGIFDR